MGGIFLRGGNSVVLDKECKECSHCGYTYDEFFKVSSNYGKKYGTQL